MNTTPILPGLEEIVKPFRFAASPYEYKVTSLRECPTPENLQQCDTPDRAADYWRISATSIDHRQLRVSDSQNTRPRDREFVGTKVLCIDRAVGTRGEVFISKEHLGVITVENWVSHAIIARSDIAQRSRV